MDSFFDVIADGPDGLDGLPSRVGQFPVLITLAGENGAGVATTHRHHDIEALGRMAAQILHTAASRLPSEHRCCAGAPPSRWLTQFRHNTTSPVHHQVVIADIAVQDRPPLTEIHPRGRQDTAAASASPGPQR